MVSRRVGDQRYEGRVKAMGREPLPGKAWLAYERRVVFETPALLHAGRAAVIGLP